MKKISRRAFLRASGLLAATALSSGLTGCGKAASGSSSAASSAASAPEHEPLHILTAGRDYTDFLALLHSRYPEVRVELDAYYGQNRSAYTRRQLNSGILPDIYTCTYFWDPDKQAEYLLDLSAYPVSERYAASQMNQTDVDGATYLLPYDFTISGIGCNASLFQRNGWALPASFAELQALAPQIEQSGTELCLCQINLPGLAFQLFCGISDTVFLNTHPGRVWQASFLSGEVNASSFLQESAAFFQKWIDCGMFNQNHPDFEVDRIFSLFQDGNAAFLTSNITQFSRNTDGTGDQYALLPYLSPDGENNTYVLRTERFYGLNKQLAEPGNEQKLEDALHFLEVLSSVEGFECIHGSSATVMSALTDFSLPDTSPYHAPLEKIRAGHSAPYLYAGWQDYAADFGDAVRRWIGGELDADTALRILDDLQHSVLSNGGPVVYATVTETLDTLQTAQLVGQIFLQAVGADAALISCNETKPGVHAWEENVAGVSGSLLPGPLTEEDLVAYLPTGWYDTIYTVTLPGARLKELAAAGYDKNQTGDAYPYAFVTADGKELQDDQTYTAVLCGAARAVWREGGCASTGIVGLDAAKAYFQNVDTVSRALIV